MLLNPDEFHEYRTVFEKLTKLQHYEIPTRLLDITSNPLVALYFACANYPEEEKDKIKHSLPGCVWSLRQKIEDVKFYDSDTVSMLANLALMDFPFLVQAKNASRDSVIIGENIQKKNHGITDNSQRYFHFIKSEKAYFNFWMKFKDMCDCFFVKPSLQNNRRLDRQNGAFIIFGLGEKSFNNVRYGFKSVVPQLNQDIMNMRIDKVNDIEKKLLIIIEPEVKSDILDQLDSININLKTLFPEIDKSAKYITKHI